MSKITSKLQVTLPKKLADEYGMRPGDELQWASGGSVIRVIPGRALPPLDLSERLRLFDEATRRIRSASRKRVREAASSDRGWRRDDLYDRPRTR